jgi:hypothetical protein
MGVFVNHTASVSRILVTASKRGILEGSRGTTGSTVENMRVKVKFIDGNVAVKERSKDVEPGAADTDADCIVVLVKVLADEGD